MERVSGQGFVARWGLVDKVGGQGQSYFLVQDARIR